ncbi:MAG: hypothetical protein GXO07_06155 [Crenarchaeota archaeon]|nr:hypothetical protein [Thermoproteota archaeon]
MSVLSPMGGSGKTLLLAELAQRGFVALTASPISLFLRSYEILERHEIYDVLKARIVADRCEPCYKCVEACKKGAITRDLRVVEGLCEGCPACAYACPKGAIKFVQAKGAEYSIMKAGKGYAVELRVEPGLREEPYLEGLKGVAKRLSEDAGAPYLVEGSRVGGSRKALLVLRSSYSLEERLREFEEEAGKAGAEAAVVLNLYRGPIRVRTSLPVFEMPPKEDPAFEDFVEEVASWILR